MESVWGSTFTKFCREFLEPSRTDIKYAKATADRIFKILQTNGCYELSQGVVKSLHKKSNIAIEFDLELIVHVKDVSFSNFPHIIDVFQSTLETDDSSLDVSFEHFSRPTEKMLRVTANGFVYDVIPALYFPEEKGNSSQIYNAINSLENPVRDGYKYTNSFKWIDTNRNHFCHQLVNLVKFWDKCVFVDENISNRAAIFEHIALRVAAVEEKGHPHAKSIGNAFKSFLKHVAHFHEVVVIPEKVYKKNDVDPEILRQRPLVLDSCNPYCNLAYDLYKNPRVMKKFEEYAVISLDLMGIETEESYECETQPNLLSVFMLPAIIPAVDACFVRGRELKWKINVENNDDVESKVIRVVLKNCNANPTAVKIWKHLLCHNLWLLKKEETKCIILEKFKEFIDEIGCVKNDWDLNVNVNWDVVYQIPFGDWVIKINLKVV